jgi:hypothetical protein
MGSERGLDITNAGWVFLPLRPYPRLDRATTKRFNRRKLLTGSARLVYNGREER